MNSKDLGVLNEHTPGPWRECAKAVDGVVAENYREIFGGAECESQTDDTSLWGYDCLNLTGFISPANARLIAAAPDLLNGCRALLGLLQLVTCRDDISPELVEVLRGNHRIAEAHAAVKKATGTNDNRSEQ